MNTFAAVLLSLFFLGTGRLDTTPPAGAETEASMYCTLQLVGLKCVTSEGYITNDAIYFKIGGEEWPRERISMSSGDYFDLEGYVNLTFDGSIKVELWDDDTFDPDDFLGSNVIPCRYDSDGVVRFTEDGADYKLYYRVK